MGVLWLDEVDKDDLLLAGGKGANLGELLRMGIPVPEGFIVDSKTFKDFIEKTGLKDKIIDILNKINVENTKELENASKEIRKLIESTPMPKEVEDEIKNAYRTLCKESGDVVYVAVRSSATAEDLPSVSADEFVLAKIDGYVRLMRVCEVYSEFIKGREVEIPAMNGNRIVWTKVKDVYRHNGHGKMLKIRTKTGRELTVSPNHSVIVLDEITSERYVVPYATDLVGKKVPVTAGIEPNPVVSSIDVRGLFGDACISRNGRVFVKGMDYGLPEVIEIDYDLMFFFGLFLANGTIDGSRVRIRCKRQDSVERIRKAIEKLGIRCEISYNGYFLDFCSAEISELLKLLFLSDGIRRVPDLLFNVDRENMRAFISGVFSECDILGDEASLDLSSDILCAGIVKLLEFLRVPVKIVEGKSILIPISHIEQIVNREEYGMGDCWEVVWDEVSEVKVVDYRGVVYDFIVPGLENFSCGIGGIITHNSASFAGQQETYLNVRGENEVVDKVKKCWSSLYTPRAIYYRVRQGFRHEDVSIAVVVQKMVNSEKSGVMFTSHPTTGEKITIIEAVFGLGEAIVSGMVTPDYYEYDRIRRKIVNVKVSNKKFAIVRQNGKNVKIELGKKGEERVLSDDEIEELVRLGEIIEEHYGTPQDIEWAIEKGKIYIVQSRAVTTIKPKDVAEKEAVEEGEILVKGLGASPGIGIGRVKIVLKPEDISKIEKGDVLVAVMTNPDMVPAMRKASAIVTNEGGLTCHAAIVSRELGVPAVVGTKNATEVLKDGMLVTVDGEKGIVYKGAVKKKKEEERVVTVAQTPIITATEIKVNISIPDVAERIAKETNADGVGLFRIEHMVLGLKKHPMKYIRDGEIDEYVNELYKGMKKVVKAFYPRPVWIRTLDAPTDEFRHMEGGEDEPIEANPMMGFRGIRRDLKEEIHFRAEMRAIKKLIDEGYTNVGIMLPLVTRVEEVRRAKEIAMEEGIPLDKIDFGIMVETPASALIIEDIIKEGITFISFGTNDLTQYTLAVDRNNENVAYLYDETHPAVMKLIEHVIRICKKYGVKTSICGQAGSYPHVVRKLVEMGIDSISANPDAVQMIREVVARVERKIMLDRIRGEKQ